MLPRPERRKLLLWLCAAAISLAAPAAGDEGPDGGAMFVSDPLAEQLDELRYVADPEDLAPLWDWRDKKLEAKVVRALDRIGLSRVIARKRMGAALVILDGDKQPRVAAVNPDLALYAASLPKIAVLLGAFDRIDRGELKLTKENESLLFDMMRISSNTAATEMMRRVGLPNIARTMLDERYRLYDPEHNGGLWVGKDYAKAGLWRRDPLHNLSHGATAMQVARFYYLLVTDNLVTPEYCRKMREILLNSELNHKFVRALRQIDPDAAVSRKSGSWSTFHSDSVLVERDGHRYIAVALSNNSNGSKWLGSIITELDTLIVRNATTRDQHSMGANPVVR